MNFNFIPDQDELGVNLRYSKPNSSSIGWLNYIEMNVWRELVFSGGQMSFRTIDYVGGTDVLRYGIVLQSSHLGLWDVSVPINVKSQDYNLTTSPNTLLAFTQNDASLKEYILFDELSFLIPESVGVVPNQNYHDIPVSDLIIVSPSEFRNQAQRLANFHADNDGLSYCIVEPSKLYNEFSFHQ